MATGTRTQSQARVSEERGTDASEYEEEDLSGFGGGARSSGNGDADRPRKSRFGKKGLRQPPGDDGGDDGGGDDPFRDDSSEIPSTWAGRKFLDKSTE